MTVKIKAKGPVISEDEAWIYDYFGISNYIHPGMVSAAIEQATSSGEDIEIEINSPGGYVYEGSEIYSMLKSFDGKVTGNIFGIAASAASVIAMGCEILNISPTAQIMIHNAANISMGDYRDHEKSAEMLRKTNQSIAKAYQLKSGMSQEEVLTMMDNETFFTADDAKEKGLVDSILFEEAGNVKMVASLTDNQLIPQAVIAKFLKENNVKNQASNQKIEPEEDDKKVKNLDELKEKYPDIYNQALAEGSKNATDEERKRVSDLIEIQKAPGASAVVDEMIKNGGTAADASMQILKNSMQATANAGANRSADATNSGAGDVPVAPVTNVSSDEAEKAKEQARVDNMIALAQKNKGGKR